MRRMSRRAALKLWAVSAVAAASELAPRASWAAAGAFASAERLASWQADLDALGLRATANAAHERYIDVLAERLKRAGLRDVRAERVAVRRWSARRWTLELPGDGGASERLPTVSYIPYSGATPASGVIGRLAGWNDGGTVAPGALRRAVVLFDLAPQEVPNAGFRSIAYEVVDPRQVLTDDGTYQRWQPGRARLILDELEKARAAAAIGVLDLPPQASVSGYYPYDGVVRSVPGLYVDRATGQRLRAAVAAGAQARVTLVAETRQAASRNLVATIAGASRETVILNSHTDGPNGIEDNGPNAIVAMAERLTALPRRRLPRTVVVSLTTGHFHGAAGQRAFVARHRD